MTHMVESHLVLTHAPLSIRDFNHLKTVEFHRELLNQATLYAIARKEVSTLKVNEEASNANAIFLDVEMKKAGVHLDICIPYRENEHLFLDGFYGIDGISSEQGRFEEITIYSYEKVDDESSVKIVAQLTLEDIFYLATHNFLKVGFRGNILPFMTYEVLYVGECVDERITDRFKAHHALQHMLIEEKAISPQYRNSDELFLMPFRSEANIISCLTYNVSEKDWFKAFNDDFSFGEKEVNLDCEKALVHSMNPKYNQILFKNYPISKNGLHNTEAEIYSYSILENVVLKYKDGEIIGNPEPYLVSVIVGDKQGKCNVYAPGENYTEQYVRDMFTLKDADEKWKAGDER